mmetsp:Transcript_94171/g.294622  ORF Transcript_94171/g.294622 Transcript_94171/m.294622 type:complete len:303 (+) Transcript_94171:690-1598(+)
MVESEALGRHRPQAGCRLQGDLEPDALLPRRFPLPQPPPQLSVHLRRGEPLLGGNLDLHAAVAVLLCHELGGRLYGGVETLAGGLLHAFSQEIQGQLREVPHVFLAVVGGGLNEDALLHRPGNKDGRETCRDVREVEGGPAGAVLGDAPGGPHLSALTPGEVPHPSNLCFLVGGAVGGLRPRQVRAEDRDGLVGAVGHRTAGRVGGGARNCLQGCHDESSSGGLEDRHALPCFLQRLRRPAAHLRQLPPLHGAWRGPVDTAEEWVLELHGARGRLGWGGACVFLPARGAGPHVPRATPSRHG